MDQRLRANQRIRGRRDFQAVFKHGFLAKGKVLRLWCYERQGYSAKPQQPQIGIVVSRKTSALSTDRNLWKRRIREAFRRIQNQIKMNTKIVVRSAHQKRVPSYENIHSELKLLLSKVGGLR